MVDTARGGAPGQAQPGSARTCLVSGLAASASGSTSLGTVRPTVLEMKEPGLLPPRAEPAGGGLRPLVYQLGAGLPLCWWAGKDR
jgi:hypothetical protein